MKRFKTGLSNVIKGIIGGILLSLILHIVIEYNLIPSEISYLLTIIILLSSLITLLSFWKAGILFILGWILGAWLLRGFLSGDDYLVNLVAPMLTLLIRMALFIGKHT